ncbi:putative conserved/ 2TM domain-containing membrane protein [Synechococcus sp. MEDNS5]|nr:putative conserved/ 2TM domain-containing membrane protein [Synechococcus sp. MEDNS5]
MVAVVGRQLRLYFIVHAILVFVWLGSGPGSFWPICSIAF